MIAAEAVAVVLLVDFVSGVVHWAEDSFGTVHTPVIGPCAIGWWRALERVFVPLLGAPRRADLSNLRVSA